MPNILTPRPNKQHYWLIEECICFTTATILFGGAVTLKLADNVNPFPQLDTTTTIMGLGAAALVMMLIGLALRANSRTLKYETISFHALGSDVKEEICLSGRTLAKVGGIVLAAASIGCYIAAIVPVDLTAPDLFNRIGDSLFIFKAPKFIAGDALFIASLVCLAAYAFCRYQVGPGRELEIARAENKL